MTTDTIGEFGDSPVRTPLNISGGAALLRLVVVAVLMALLIPAMALAEESGTAVMEPPASETPASAPASEAPATEAPAAPADEAAPAVEPAPVSEGSGAPDETPATAPPPASEAPATPAPAPSPGTEAETPPVGDILEPVLAPTLPELVPGTGVPAEPVARTPVTPVMTPLPDALPVPRMPVVPGGPMAAVGPAVMGAPTTPGLAGALGAPTAPAAAAVEPPADAPPLATVAPPADLFGADHSVGAFAPTVAAEPPVAPISALAAAQPPPPAFTVQVTSPEGSVPSGSSLLEVLAGYVLPGSSGPPASSIIFLVLLGTLLMALYAPRPQLSERIHLLGLLGPRSGHGLAVRRPG